jgi:hypothetical protein
MELFRVARPVRPAVSRRLLLGAVALAFGGLLPATAQAAPERGVLVVEGQGGTTTEWVLQGDAPVTVRPEDVAISGGGAFAGVLIEPVDVQQQSFPLGHVQVRAFGDATRDAVGALGVDGSLEPGRYHVTLLGQGPVSVRYPQADAEAAGVRVVPRTRTPMRFLGRSETLDAGNDAARIELPGALPAGRRAIQVRLTDGTEAGQVQMCATTGSVCERPVLPACPPSPLPCDSPTVSGPGVAGSTGSPQATVALHRAAPAARTLLWSFDGYRDVEGKLRAAAIIL